MAQQTAVEWLIQKLRKPYSDEYIDKIIEQAKAMERDQQFDFFIAGQLSTYEGGKDFQQYLKLWPSLTIDPK